MDTIGYDALLNRTDSRYRLSTIVAKRAVQLKKGFPSSLKKEDYPKNRDGVSHNVVAVSLQELLLNKDIVWGETLPSDAELIKAFELKKKNDAMNYSVTLRHSATDVHDDEPSYTITDQRVTPPVL